MKNDFYAELLSCMLEKTPLMIYSNFIFAMKQDKRLTSFDEEIFNDYIKVIGYFRNSEKIYADNTDRIKSKAVRKLLSGLISVIKSRIAICDETLSDYKPFGLMSQAVNPVYEEKRGIVEQAKNEIKEKILKISERCADKMRCKFGADAGTDQYIDFYRKSVMGELIKLNDSIVKKYTALLNDIEQRKVVSGLYSLLKEEAQVLGAVIKVQANELERTNQTADEETIIQAVLFQLREAYQYTIFYVDKIMGQFNAVENPGKPYHCNIDEFEPDTDRIKSFVNENKDIVYNEIQELFESIESLTENISKSFCRMLNADRNTEGEEKNTNDIVNGIDETIRIKVESIEEAKENLLQTAKDKKLTRERAKKIIDIYLRQFLLFELTTFQEIMTYSVSRLRNNNRLKEYVNVIDTETENINIYLREKGIEIIEPEPRDIFNAREHDILMAEKAEGFKKGEIIRVMTKGYKSGSTVYIRASVIAAK